jgi:hypothetical protein
MAGYLVFHSSTPVKLNPIHLGLFDLVREFEQDPFPFSRAQGLTLTGLDDLLDLLDQKEGLNENRPLDLMRNMRRRLSSCAEEVSRLGLIHVPLHMKPDLGADGQLYATYNRLNKRIPLWQLFGSNPSIRESGGHRLYEFGESLS